MEYHEIVSKFPRMESEAFNALVEDIRLNGLKEKIWTYKGKIIDGRHRFEAIQALRRRGHKVEPSFREWDGSGSLLAFVASMNFHRRDLSPVQRAVLAVEIEEDLAKEARERQRQAGGDRKAKGSLRQKIAQAKKGKAAEMAAKSSGTNRKYVYDAKKIKNSAPELLDEVLTGDLNLQEAKKVAELPLETRTEAVKAIKAESTPQAKQKAAKEFTKPVRREPSFPIYSKWYDSIIKIQAAIEEMGRYDSRDVALEIERWEEKDRRVYADRLMAAAKSLARMYTELTSEEVFLDEEAPAEPFHYTN